MERIRQLAPRNWGSSLANGIARINCAARLARMFGIASPSAHYVLRARRPYPAKMI